MHDRFSATPKRSSNTDGFLGQSLPCGKVQRAPLSSVDVVRQYRRAQPAQLQRPKITNAQPPITPQSQTPFPKYYSPYIASGVNSAAKPVLKKTKKRWKKKVLRTTLVGLAIFFIVGGWLGWKIVRNTNKIFGGNIISNAEALFGTSKLKGEDQGRVNILLAGDSADDPNHGGAQLTDSIMVVSIDTVHHTGFMLSVPRDLWVNIPGWSHQKINAANEVNNFNQVGYPKGGMGQLEQIVSQNLGIPINYYALINYTAFKDAVNAVGGITVNIQSSDPRGLYDPNINKLDKGPLRLSNGVQTLDGQTALNLARARGDPTHDGRVAFGFDQNDFTRTQHQRQMLTALGQKAQSAGVVTNPIKIGQLFDALGNNVATDLKLADVLRFVQITKGMDVTGLKSLSLSESGSDPLLMGYRAPDGESALVPKAGIDNFGQIQQYYQKLTSNDPAVKESPSVVVLNGSNVVGQAHKEEAILQAKGFNVSTVTDANHIYANTMIVDKTNNQKPASRQSLQQLLSTTPVSITPGSLESQEAQAYNADFVVILGRNAASQ